MSNPKGVVQKDGQLVACLRNSYLSYMNVLRHNLDAAYGTTRSHSKKLPSLKDYLKDVNDIEKEESNGTDGTEARDTDGDGETPRRHRFESNRSEEERRKRIKKELSEKRLALLDISPKLPKLTRT